MPEQRPHDVHLSVARTCVGAAPVDFFKNDGGLRDAEPCSAILRRDESRQISRLGQLRDELLRVAALDIQLPPVRIRETRANFPYALAQMTIKLRGFGRGALFVRVAEIA